MRREGKRKIRVVYFYFRRPFNRIASPLPLPCASNFVFRFLRPYNVSTKNLDRTFSSNCQLSKVNVFLSPPPPSIGISRPLATDLMASSKIGKCEFSAPRKGKKRRGGHWKLEGKVFLIRWVKEELKRNRSAGAINIRKQMCEKFLSLFI